MADLSPYINSASFGLNASAITGQSGDAIYAGSVAALVNSICGTQPSLVTNPDGKTVTILLSSDQIIQMQAWLDSLVMGAIAPDSNVPDTVSFDMSPVLIPWALKYAIPAMLVCVVAGFAIGKWVK